MNPMETLTEEALRLKLRSTEHDFVERKPRGQKGDWLQTAVAFANSAPIGWPAILFVGVDNGGNPQQGPEKQEDLAKSVAAVTEQVFPPIYFDIRPLHIGERACLAVVIPGSNNRPHFAGKAYIRVGPSIQEASEPQFAELIASRSSKAREIQSWIGKDISWIDRRGAQGDFHRPGRVIVSGCNSHYATFDMRPQGGVPQAVSEPLSRLELSFDHNNKRLQIILYTVR